MIRNGKKRAYFVTLSLIISIAAALMVEAKTIDAVASWAAGPVTIEGSLSEWKNMPTTFFEEERLVLGISNDADNLYLFMRTDDVQLIRTIRMAGIKIYLDPKAKKKKDLSFHYRGGPSMIELEESGIIDTSQRGNRLNDERRQPMMKMTRDTIDNMVLSDNNLELEETIPVDGSQGPVVRYGFEHGFCIYEMSIPFEDHKIDYYGFNSGPGKEISIGIKWGGRPDRKMGADGPPGGMGGGRGGMGGGRGGMGGDGGGRGRMQLPEEKEFWIKTKLAASMPEK